MNNDLPCPVGNHIFFQFEDEVRNGHFVNKHSSGIIIDMGGNHQYSAHYSRVGKVIAVGSRVKNVTIGDRIAIKTLMWTDHATTLNGIKFWMTNEDHIMGIVG